MFKLGHDTQRLRIMIEAAIGFHPLIQRIFAGMPKRRVTKVMHECYGFGEIFIKPQSARQSTGNLRHFNRVGQAGSIMIPLMGDEHLCLMLETAKSGGMDDSIAIPLERRSCSAFRLRHQPTSAQRRITGIGRSFAIAEANSFQLPYFFSGHCDAFLTVI